MIRKIVFRQITILCVSRLYVIIQEIWEKSDRFLWLLVILMIDRFSYFNMIIDDHRLMPTRRFDSIIKRVNCSTTVPFVEHFESRRSNTNINQQQTRIESRSILKFKRRTVLLFLFLGFFPFCYVVFILQLNRVRTKGTRKKRREYFSLLLIHFISTLMINEQWEAADEQT